MINRVTFNIKMQGTKRRGRPPLPDGHVKGKYVPVRLSDEDLELFTKAMEKSECSTLSGWIRLTLRKAAKRK